MIRVVSGFGNLSRCNLNLLYGSVIVAHLLIRLFGSDNLNIDDSEQVSLLYNYGLAPGYPLDQPPLYTWLLYAVFQCLGPSLLSIVVVKYGLIVATVAVGFRISSHLFPEEDYRLLGAGFLLLLWVFFYQTFVGFTHTMILSLAIFMTLDALLGLQKRQRAWEYIYFGLAVGVGFLSKYSYPIFFIPLLFSSLTISSFRRAIFNRRIWLAFLMVVAIAGPHVWWLCSDSFELSGRVEQKLRLTPPQGVTPYFLSLVSLFKGGIGFLLPFLLIYLVAFPHVLNRVKKVNDHIRLFSRFYLLLLVMTVALGFAVYIPHFRSRWLHPVFMVFPFFFLLRVREKECAVVAKKTVWMSTLACSAIGVLYHAETYLFAPYFGNPGRPNYPIVETLAALPEDWLHREQICVPDPYLRAQVLLHNWPDELIIDPRAIDTERSWILFWHSDMPGVLDWVADRGEKSAIREVRPDRRGVLYPIFYLASE